MRLIFFILAFVLYGSFPGFGQLPGLNDKLGELFVPPAGYVITYAIQPPQIDGDISDKIWQQAVWTDYFRDIEGDVKPKPYYNTRAKMLWDDTYLYIAAELEDPHVWANLKNRDEVVFYDNDFEVFIDPENTTHRYFEYEINAYNTIFDLFLPKPYRAGSGALISWDSNRLKHAVKIHGSINKPDDKDKGWTVEMAIPFSDITIGNNTHVPKEGEIWRLNFSRVQWETDIVNGEYVKKKDKSGKVLPENNWVWSPQGVVNMHLPERWGYILFTRKDATKSVPAFVMPYSEKQRQYLWLVFYKQHEYKRKNGQYADSLDKLNIKEIQFVDNVENKLTLSATPVQFSAKISDSKGPEISINDEGNIHAPVRH